MKNRAKAYILIIFLSIIFAIPLFHPNFNIYIDDGIQHICRLMGTYQSITEGQTFSVIMSSFCNAFGYSWNLFYSPLTAYVPLIFHLFTDSFVICLKCFMVLITILSGIAMYEFIYRVTKKQYIAILGAIFYIFVPYRFTDMYMRVAIAELASFIFLPMVFHGLYNIYVEDEEENPNKKRGELILIIGASGLILSHTVIALYTAMFSAIYVCIHIRQLKNKTVALQLLCSIIGILLLTSFYWVPMLEHKITTDYEVFRPGRMEDEPKMQYFKTHLWQLVYTEDGSLSVELGILTIIGLMLTLVAYKKINSRYKKMYLFCLISGILSVFITLKGFPFEKLPSILKLIQFPFRMFEFSAFFFSVVVAINYGTVIKNFGKKDVAVLGIICILLMLPLIKNIQFNTNYKESNLWPAVPVTENTKRIHAGCATFEYLPTKAFQNLNYIKTRENTTYIVQGNAAIQEEKNGTNMRITLTNIEKNTKLELPYIYYLGYTVVMQTEDSTIELKPYESENGFLQVDIPDNTSGTIKIEYTGTISMQISAIISILTIIGCISLKIYDRRKLHNYFNNIPNTVDR